MSTHDLYALPADRSPWDIRAAGHARFNWEYDGGRDRLLALYQKGKDKQWDSTRRIDWSLEVDPDDPLGLPDETISIHGTRTWDKLSDANRAELRRHGTAWQFSQFLHGEQGAMICSARIVETVPDLDAKFYAATQTIDEARHAETYARFLQEKIGVLYPINENLRSLLDDTLSDSRWDMPYLGMQVLIEGLALAAFGLIRDLTDRPLPKQILAYVMQDEARHVAFGRMALRDYYAALTETEIRDREEFVIEACHLMRERFRGEEVWENFGFDIAECREATDNSPYMQMFRRLLFNRIVPCIKDIGLWTDRLRETYRQIGVLDFADENLDKLMRQDEEQAEALDARRFAAEERERGTEVETIVSLGSDPAA